MITNNVIMDCSVLPFSRQVVHIQTWISETKNFQLKIFSRCPKMFPLTQCKLYRGTQPNEHNTWVQDTTPIDCNARTSDTNCTSVPEDRQSNGLLRRAECNISLVLPHPEWIDATPNKSDFHSDGLFPYRQWCRLGHYCSDRLSRFPFYRGKIACDGVSGRWWWLCWLSSHSLVPFQRMLFIMEEFMKLVNCSSQHLKLKLYSWVTYRVIAILSEAITCWNWPSDTPSR